MRRVKAEFGIIGPVFRSDIILGGTALDLTERYSMDSAWSRTSTGCDRSPSVEHPRTPSESTGRQASLERGKAVGQAGGSGTRPGFHYRNTVALRNPTRLWKNLILPSARLNFTLRGLVAGRR